uniref:Uncharacterized protein n=1 Tax=viral metagenome TaxID=1070528 RepID=A0A6C0HTR4_9ZZZZ
MGFLDFIFSTAARKGAEQSNNEIKFDNFVPKAKDKNILTVIPQCKYEESGWFGNYTVDINEVTKGNKNVSYMHLDVAYLELYDYLVKKEIIIKKFGAVFVITFDSIYTINEKSIEISTLSKIIKKENPDYPKILKCYTIDYKKLSELLKNYKYDYTDEIRDPIGIITDQKNKKSPNKGGKKNIKHKKNKTKKRTLIKF